MRTLRAIFTLLILTAGCASTPKNEYVISNLIPENLHVRRPLREGSVEMDCMQPSALFEGYQLGAIRDCLRTINKPYNAIFRLRRELVPFLELEQEEATPACLKTLTPTIPVPREIVFESIYGGTRECFSSRLDIEANETLGFKLPTHKLALNVTFPLEDIPEDDQETLRLLNTWSLSLFFDPKVDGFKAHYLPQHLCRKCLGPWNENPAPVFWP